jgi:enoyl-CoA hydratase/carnithine racemase
MSTPSSDDVIQTWRDDVMMVIAIRRPDDDNRTNGAVMRAIATALDDSDADPAVRVVALTGDRQYFSHGGRIDGYAENDVQQQLEFGRAFTVMHARMAASTKPLIAVVEGHCISGGMSLLDACDLAVAAEDVRFGFAEIEAGIFPFLAMASFYGRMPPKRTFDWFYSGRLFSAQEALEAGLINRVVPPDQVWDEARLMARELSNRSGPALAIGRQTYYGMANMSPAGRLNTHKACLRRCSRRARSRSPCCMRAHSVISSGRLPPWNSIS